MKKQWKQGISILLAIMVVITSGIIPENMIKVSAAEKSDYPSEKYPYYCPFCKYYYEENESHLCDVSKICPNCDGTGSVSEIPNLCKTCNGTGNMISREMISPSQYRITFDANGGILDGVDYIYTSDSLNKTVTAFKNGCDFLGWSTKKDASIPDAHLYLNEPQTLYAVFSNKTSTITFDTQGAFDDGTKQIEAIKGNAMPEIILPRKEYTITFDKNTEDANAVISSDSLKNTFIFQGYYTEINGNGIKYYDQDGFGTKDWDGEEDITLYASWENNGVLLPIANRRGYTFKGWSVSPSAEYGMQAGENYKTEENDTILYAIWSKNTYKIQYDLAGGVVEKANPDIYDIETETFTLNNPTKEGYNFAGWISSDGEEKQIKVSIPKGSIGNKIYTASWIVKTNTLYKVEIYKMDLSGAYPSSANEVKNLYGTSNTKVNAQELAREYLYPGFTYQYAKVNQEIAEEMTISGNGSAVLQLFYGRNQYQFNLGTQNHVRIKGTTAVGNYYQGDLITLKAQPDKGYHWVKWQSSNPSLLSDYVEKDGSITMPIGAITMTPKVEPDSDITYKVVIHRETLQGDYSDTENIIVKKKGITDAKVNAATMAASYQYEGFTYCYARSYDSKSKGAKANMMYIDAEGTSELHLYYSRNSYKLTIGNYDTSKVIISNKKERMVFYEEKVKLKASVLDGYKFSHWDSSNTKMQADLKTRNATLTMAASDITMTPIAEDITYTIEFEANDSNANTPENNVRAAIVPEKAEYNYNEEIIMPSCIRKGFTFLGWSFSRNGAVAFTENAKASKLSSIDKDIVKLYAKWEENKYSIQFQPNDDASTAHNPLGNVKATGSTQTTGKFYYTDNIMLPKNGFKRDGFTFLGWSVEKNSNDVEYNSGDFVHSLCEINNGIITLYAAWTEKSYPISFEPCDNYCYGSKDGIIAKVINEDSMSNVTRVYYTDGFVMPDCKYIRPGFTFVGWSRDKNASKKTYQDSSYRGELQPESIISDLNTMEKHCYYPVWLENKYTVLFDKNAESAIWTSDKMRKNVYYTESWSLDDRPSQIGYELEGYAESSDADKIQYKELSDLVKLAGKEKNGEIKTIYAFWKPNKLVITYESEGIISDYSQGIQYGQLGIIADEMITDFYKEEKIFLGWSKKPQKGFGTKKDVDYYAEQESSQCFGLADKGTDHKLHLYAVWSNAVPIIIEQTKNSDFNAEIEPYTEIPIFVSAIGEDITYQWYCQKKSEGSNLSEIIISEEAIQGATESIYTIPAENVIEENDGMAYYCIITGNSGQQIKSDPVTINVYGTPTIPKISIDTDVKENGWSNKSLSILVSGSAIKGKKEQVEYVYSFDKIKWIPYKELIWTENTALDGKNIYFKAYNKDCPKLESFLAEYTIKKDDEVPIITKIERLKEGNLPLKNTEFLTNKELIRDKEFIKDLQSIDNRVDSEETKEMFWFQVYADDIHSGISRYAFIKGNNQPEENDWKEESVFYVSDGQYRVYVMDCAGNIAMQGITIYENGYFLPFGESGSYIDGEQCSLLGEGIAKWDHAMEIDKDKITSIFIEDGITEIPDRFFQDFINLKSITIPDSIVKVSESAFEGVPKTMIIYASHGSIGEEIAQKFHYTKYEIEIEGKEKDNKISVHYYDKIIIPFDEMDRKNKTLIGFGTKPEKKDFSKGEAISGLSSKMDGYIKLYPIYTDAYIDTEGILHITGDNTDYLDDIISNKEMITEIVIESSVTTLPKQIPDDFKNLKKLTLSENLKDLSQDRFEGMPENSIIYRPWEMPSDDKKEEEDKKEEDKKPEDTDKEDNNTGNNNIESGNVGNNTTGSNNIGNINTGNSVGNTNSIGTGTFIGGYNPPSITEEYIQQDNMKNDKLESNITKTEGKQQSNTEDKNKYDVDTKKEVLKDKLIEQIQEDKEKKDVSVDETGERETKKKIDKRRILVQINLSSIILEKGENYKIKALKGVKKWSIRDKKIVKLKKSGKDLILIGKKSGKTILVGKHKRHKYQYIIQVKKTNKKEIKLQIKGKENTRKQILTTSGAIIKNIVKKEENEKIIIKLLYAKKNIVWESSRKGVMKKKGNTAVITMGKKEKCTITAKYKGKLYQCSLFSIS